MKILHTADWHLGVELEERSRMEEAKALLKHILKLAKENAVDALLVSGDVFNTHSPSNQATKLYYDFLKEVHKTQAVKDVVVIAGNHDSPSYLEAPAGVLEVLNVHVVGSVQEGALEREIVPLKNAQGEIEAVVCAVPYMVSPGLASKSKEEQDCAYENFVAGHYKDVVDLAKTQYPGKPIIAMGHFYATGGKVNDDTAIRGNLHSIHLEKLPMGDIAYLALGHLHRPQDVNGRENARYSGSLMKMNFTECDMDKCVVLWDSTTPDTVQELPLKRSEIPEICQMAFLEGDVSELTQKLKELSAMKRDGVLWVAALNTGVSLPDLRTHLRRVVEEDASIDIVYAKNKERFAGTPGAGLPPLDLKEMKPMELFDIILKEQVAPSATDSVPQIPEEDQQWYTAMVAKIIDDCMMDQKTSPESDATDGESSDGESSDGESSDGESSDGESSDGESSDGESSDGESSDGESQE